MLDFFADIKSGIRSGNVRFQEDLTLPILNQIYVRKKVKKCNMYQLIPWYIIKPCYLWQCIVFDHWIKVIWYQALGTLRRWYFVLKIGLTNAQNHILRIHGNFPCLFPQFFRLAQLSGKKGEKITGSNWKNLLGFRNMRSLDKFIRKVKGQNNS